MTNNIIKKINDEIVSLTALSIINLIFGAVAIAIGVSNSVNHISPLIESFQISFTSFIFIFFAIGLGVIGLYWLISSANILDFTTDIQLAIHKEKTQKTDESITSIIIQMIAFYRKNTKKIQQMIIMSQTGGILFIGYAIISVITLHLESSDIGLLLMSIQIIGLVLIVLVGIACFIIPRFFKKYACIWDSRIKEAENVEKTLKERLRSQ